MPRRDRTPLLYVTIDDARAPVDLTRAVLSFSVDEHDEKATKISLTLDDPEQRFRTMLPEGATIAVRWGWVGELSTPRGGIVHKAEYRNDDFTLSIEAYGKELALSRGPIRRTFRGQTLRQSVEALARDSGLRVEWSGPDTITFDGAVVDDESAWAWIQRQSASLGLTVTVEGDRILVREPPLGDPPTRVLLWGWRGATMTSFEVTEDTKKSEKEHEGVVAVFVDPASGQQLQFAAGSTTVTRRTLAQRRLDAARRVTTASDRAAISAYVSEHPELASRSAEDQAAAWRAATARRASANTPPTEDEPSMLTVQLDSGDVHPTSTPRTAPVSPTSPNAPAAENGRQVSSSVAAPASAAREHGRRVAEGTFKAHERAKVKAEASCEGEPTMRRGEVIRILGCAERDAGLWYVKGLKHELGDGYVTSLELTRDGVNGGRGRRRAGTSAQPSGSAQSGSTAGAATGATSDRVAVDLARESG